MTSFYLLKVPAKGERASKVKIAEIPGFVSKRSRYDVLVDDSSKLNVAISMGSEIVYFVYDLISQSMFRELKTLKGIKDPVVDIKIIKRFETEKGKDVRYIYYLTKLRKEKDAYVAYLYETGSKEPKWYPKMNVYYPERLTITQSVIDRELRPYYLLNQMNKTFYQSYYSGDLRQILPPEKKPNMLCTFPQIIISSTLGDKYGVYVRYIENKSKFEFKFLEEITD
jgi:hypothetical protein